MLNPSGYKLRTRENADGVDLNRDYKDVRSDEIAVHVRWLSHQPNFDLTLCLHEDWESQGFYLYELNPDGRPTLADAIVAGAARHSPIEQGPLIDGRPSEAPGIIRPVDDPLMRENWPEAIYLRRHHCRLNYTLETPSATPIKTRINTLGAAVEAAIAALCA